MVRTKPGFLFFMNSDTEADAHLRAEGHSDGEGELLEFGCTGATSCWPADHRAATLEHRNLETSESQNQLYIIHNTIFDFVFQFRIYILLST